MVIKIDLLKPSSLPWDANRSAVVLL